MFSAVGEQGATEELELAGFVREDRIVGEMRWGTTIPWTPAGARRAPRLVASRAPRSLPAVDLGSALDASALRTLLDRAASERSSAIVIAKDGRIYVEAYREGYDGSPLVAMSASKSIVSLAVGLLVADGKLSLDTTMGSLFPEWRALGAKAGITVRHLLTHTSGLDPSRADFEKETIKDHALAAKLVFPPGTRFQYDNGGVDFLAVVVERAAGEPLDALLERRIFSKLDVVGAHWMKDSAGTPRGAGELFIRPVDLAKIGQLMLDGGAWHGEQIVPAEWVARSVDAGQTFEEDCGLLWWREGTFAHVLTEPVLAAWRDLGIDKPALDSARSLVGKKFAKRQPYAAAVGRALGDAAFAKLDAAIQKADHVPFAAMIADGPVRGFSARGWLGQVLVVLPSARVVAVRMRKPEDADYRKDRPETATYPTFAEDVARLVAP
jgi:CubicO group peptidase (beta-lactamase class C family)